MKLTRREYDELGAVAIRAVKTIEPNLTQKHLTRLFGRLYSNLLRSNKLGNETENAVEIKPYLPMAKAKKM